MPRYRKHPTFKFHPAQSLEPRIALSADGLAWGNAPYLTLSFAPDGTEVDGRSSSLFRLMNRLGTEEAWQGAIVDAFQTWAHQTNADVAVVDDDGSSFGIEGQQRNDDRFGDVRIGAIPMRRDTYAVAVGGGVVGGTWSGDVLFNSTLLRQFESVDEVFRVAMHEAGHVFGLEDSLNENAVMFSSGVPSVTNPTASELQDLWSRFGRRAPDINERDERNDNDDDATHLYSSDSGFDGSTPLIHPADIGQGDSDFYRFDVLDFYSGPVTLQVRTEGLSQLRSSLRVISDETGAVVAEADDSAGQSPSVSFEVDANLEDRYYVEVFSRAHGIDSVGGYALISTFDDLLATPSEVTHRYSGREFRFLEGEMIQEILSGETAGDLPFLGDDLMTNESIATATILEPVPGFEDGVKYELIGSLSNSNDLDFYEIQTIDPLGGQSTALTVSLQPVANDALAGSVQLFDVTGGVAVRTMLENDGSRQLVQFQDLAPNQTYYLSVSGSDPTTEAVGNYHLTAIGGQQEESLDTIADGSLEASTTIHEYVIDRPELVMFAFEGMDSGGGTISITIRDASGIVVAEANTTGDSFRSVPGQLLRPGRYEIEVTTDESGEYQILAATLSDPLAAAFRLVGLTPILQFGSFDDEFVFPDGPGFEPPGPSSRSLYLARLTDAIFSADVREHLCNGGCLLKTESGGRWHFGPLKSP